MTANQLRRFEVVATGPGWTVTDVLVGKVRAVVLSHFLANLTDAMATTITTLNIVREY